MTEDRTTGMRNPMNRKSPTGSAALTGLKVAASLLFLTGTLLAADPVVSNVQGLQRPGTKLVDITCGVTATALKLTHDE